MVRRDDGGTEGRPALGAAGAPTADRRRAERSVTAEVRRRSVAELDLVERRLRIGGDASFSRAPVGHDDPVHCQKILTLRNAFHSL